MLFECIRGLSPVRALCLESPSMIRWFIHPISDPALIYTRELICHQWNTCQRVHAWQKMPVPGLGRAYVATYQKYATALFLLQLTVSPPAHALCFLGPKKTRHLSLDRALVSTTRERALSKIHIKWRLAAPGPENLLLAGVARGGGCKSLSAPFFASEKIVYAMIIERSHECYDSGV